MYREACACGGVVLRRPSAFSKQRCLLFCTLCPYSSVLVPPRRIWASLFFLSNFKFRFPPHFSAPKATSGAKCTTISRKCKTKFLTCCHSVTQSCARWTRKFENIHHHHNDSLLPVFIDTEAISQAASLPLTTPRIPAHCNHPTENQPLLLLPESLSCKPAELFSLSSSLHCCPNNIFPSNCRHLI